MVTRRWMEWVEANDAALGLSHRLSALMSTEAQPTPFPEDFLPPEGPLTPSLQPLPMTSHPQVPAAEFRDDGESLYPPDKLLPAPTAPAPIPSPSPPMTRAKPLCEALSPPTPLFTPTQWTLSLGLPVVEAEQIVDAAVTPPFNPSKISTVATQRPSLPAKPSRLNPYAARLGKGSAAEQSSDLVLRAIPPVSVPPKPFFPQGKGDAVRTHITNPPPHSLLPKVPEAFQPRHYPPKAPGLAMSSTFNPSAPSHPPAASSSEQWVPAKPSASRPPGTPQPPLQPKAKGPPLTLEECLQRLDDIIPKSRT